MSHSKPDSGIFQLEEIEDDASGFLILMIVPSFCPFNWMVHSAWRESPFSCAFNNKRMLSNYESIHKTENCNISEGYTLTKRQTKVCRNDPKP